MKNFENEKPLVSICCITYNHAKYIRDALDGFMMQETDFPFEVLIHDDASTDGTADIIREYEKKYPGIIKPIYQTENQYSKGVKISTTYNYPRAQGKYIALCEGDDFWTDKRKLQIQADFMEQNHDFVLCCHGRNFLDYYKKRYYPGPYINVPEDGIECAHEMALGKIVLPTQTMFFRKDVLLKIITNLMRDIKDAPMGDLQLAFNLAFEGKIKYIKKRMATYRCASGSVTHCDAGDDMYFWDRCKKSTALMIQNSPYPEWLKEREASKVVTFSSKQKSNHSLVRLAIGKIHFFLLKLMATIRFHVYMINHGEPLLLKKNC